jgi:hypothetical protein
MEAAIRRPATGSRTVACEAAMASLVVERACASVKSLLLQSAAGVFA